MREPDQHKLNSFLDRMIGDLGAMATSPLVVLGDRLGLFKAMRDGDKITARGLAERTGTHERYVREWLAAQAAAGYVSFEDADEARFYLNPEHRRPCSLMKTAPHHACSVALRLRRSLELAEN
jgi:hypothetical protein